MKRITKSSLIISLNMLAVLALLAVANNYSTNDYNYGGFSLSFGYGLFIDVFLLGMIWFIADIIMYFVCKKKARK